MYGTWQNVDFPNILGYMIDEYTEFNLSLQSISQYNTNGIVGSTNYDLFVQLSLTGIPFVNQAYNYSTKSHNNRCMFPPCTLSSNSFSQSTFVDSACTFTSCRASDLTYNMIRVNDGLQASSGTMALNAVFVFNIYGVESSKIHKRIY
jgi:hypothetical protein